MVETQEFLVPLEQYLKEGIHIGTKFKTKYMENFIYKIRNDGLMILNVQEIDKRLKLAANFISNYNPEDIIVVCRRENGWKAVNAFSKVTGVRAFAGRYPPGILTNPDLETFTEAKLLFVTDPWQDKNVIKDAIKIGIPIIALCDTNNECNNLDFVVPCNNKGKRSLGLAYWILAREYQKSHGKEMKEGVEEFSDEE
ncbi:MAG TPA: 30S ribosomal protein S2 [Candidatus Nanoarchaeia archaeon]|nr:30S ribosomal protein S2 [Candidatus Nanoarchaeia archaeon]